MNDSPDFVITRYRRNGALDPTFGTAGLVITSWPTAPGANGAAGVAVGSNNRILVAGTAGLGPGSDIGVALAQYRPNGAGFARRNAELAALLDSASDRPISDSTSTQVSACRA